MIKSRKQTKTALHSILTKLGGHNFADKYIDGFVDYAFSGDLPDDLCKLKETGDDTYIKVIRIISKAQAEAIIKNY